MQILLYLCGFITGGKEAAGGCWYSCNLKFKNSMAYRADVMTLDIRGFCMICLGIQIMQLKYRKYQSCREEEDEGC